MDTAASFALLVDTYVIHGSIVPIAALANHALKGRGHHLGIPKRRYMLNVIVLAVRGI